MIKKRDNEELRKKSIDILDALWVIVKNHMGIPAYNLTNVKKNYRSEGSLV